MNKQEFYKARLQQKCSILYRMWNFVLLFLLLGSSLPAFGQDATACSSIQVIGTSENITDNDDPGAVFQGILIQGETAAPIKIIKIYNSDWERVEECVGDCSFPFTYPTSAGDYFVHVQYYDANWNWICETENIAVTVAPSSQPTNCEDIKVDISDLITENGVTTRTLSISHIDQTTNGIVTTIALQERGISGSNLLFSCGTDCEELINYTLEEGEYVVLISRFSITDDDFDEGCDQYIFIDVNPNCDDNDKDYICAQNDCDDNDASVGIKFSTGISCDDGDPNTENDVYFDGCTCAGTTIAIPDCNNVALSLNPISTGTIDIAGLTSPHYVVKVYDKDWNRILDCSDDCAFVGAYEDGLYRVHVILFDENWQYICETDFLEITIGGGTSCETVCQQPLIDLKSQAEVDAFCGCEVIEGNLRITGDVTSLQPLNGIKNIKGFLAIFNTELSDFSGLESIEVLETDFYIGENPNLKNLKGLENVGSINGGLIIEQNPVLENLDGLMINNTNSISLGSNDALTSIQALNKITSLSFLTITANKKLPNLEGLNNLTNLGNETTLGGGSSSLVIGGNASITTLSALSNLKNLDENLTIQFNAALTECCGIAHLIDDNLFNGHAKSGIMIDNNMAGCNSVEEILEYCNPPIDCHDIVVNIGDLQFDDGTVSRDIHIDVYNVGNQVTVIGITNRNTFENFFGCGMDCPDEIDITLPEGEYIIQMIRHPLGDITSELGCEKWVFFDVPATPCEDQDGDYICDFNDCDDTDPTQTIQLSPGAICDDLNPNTQDDVIQEDGCACTGTPIGTPQCSNIALSINPNNTGTIDIAGLTSPHYVVKVFDAYWNRILNCSDDCAFVGAYEAGLYRVHVILFDENWQYLCETDFLEITIPGVQSGSRAVSNDVFDMDTYLKAQMVQLEWIAGQISTTDNFVIERSMNGVDFESIAVVENFQKNDRFFNFIDKDPNFGSNYYRIQQTFEGNESRLSPTKKVDFYLNEKAIGVFPNPVQDRLMIQTKALNGRKASIQIYNAFGQQIEAIPSKVFNQEFETIDVATYQNGLYYLNIQADKMPLISKKFLVEKME